MKCLSDYAFSRNRSTRRLLLVKQNKNSWPALNSFMAVLTGRHWRTHGLTDVILFFLLGWLFLRNDPARKLTSGSAATVGAASVPAGAALGLWFLFVRGQRP